MNPNIGDHQLDRICHSACNKMVSWLQVSYCFGLSVNGDQQSDYRWRNCHYSWHRLHLFIFHFRSFYISCWEFWLFAQHVGTYLNQENLEIKETRNLHCNIKCHKLNNRSKSVRSSTNFNHRWGVFNAMFDDYYLKILFF